MKLPPDVVALLQRRFDSNHRDWLAAPDSAAWPLSVPLGVPSEQQARSETDAVRAWVDRWRAWQGAGQVQWLTRQWKVLGAQSVPASVSFDSPTEVARCIGSEVAWERMQRRFAVLGARWPVLVTRLARTCAALADYEEDDFDRLLNLLAWLAEHPCSQLYPRQLPVEGVDTKWLDSRRAVIAELLAQLRAGAASATDFYAVSGLRRPPALIRVRVLDAQLRAQLGGLGEMAAPLADLAQLQMKPARVLIVENLQTGLALPDMPGTVAFMALGYGVDVLGELPWLAASTQIYWGDIDTHGFAILDRARACLPDVTSLLMDTPTLLAFRHLAGVEPVQSAAEPQRLNAAEAATMAGLKQQQWGHHVRLEQERIPWPHAMQVLGRLP